MQDEYSVIFAFLSPLSLLSVEQTNRYFLEIVSYYKLWSSLFDSMFGSKLLHVGDHMNSDESKKKLLILFETLFPLNNKVRYYANDFSYVNEFLKEGVTTVEYCRASRNSRKQVIIQPLIDSLPLDPKKYIIVKGEDILQLELPFDETLDQYDLIIDMENKITMLLYKIRREPTCYLQAYFDYVKETSIASTQEQRYALSLQPGRFHGNTKLYVQMLVANHPDRYHGQVHSNSYKPTPIWMNKDPYFMNCCPGYPDL
jgi:hypothetical protein